MSEPPSPDSPSGRAEPADWAAVQDSAEYRELRATQRRFLVPASIVYLTVYFGFLLLTLGAPTLFRQTLHGGLNIGFALMSSLFVLVWLGVLAHNRIARRHWDPRIARVRAQAGRQVRDASPQGPVAS